MSLTLEDMRKRWLRGAYRPITLSPVEFLEYWTLHTDESRAKVTTLGMLVAHNGRRHLSYRGTKVYCAGNDDPRELLGIAVTSKTS